MGGGRGLCGDKLGTRGKLMEQWYHDIFKAVCVQRHVYMGDAPLKKRKRMRKGIKEGKKVST